MNYIYTLGEPHRIIGDPLGDRYAPPLGSLGMLDLRSALGCEDPVARSSSNNQVVLTWFSEGAPIPASHTVLNSSVGDLREIPATEMMHSIWQLVVGTSPRRDATLLTMLSDHITTHSDPANQSSTGPLQPHNHQLQIVLQGHGDISLGRFNTAHPHWAKYADLKRRDIAQIPHIRDLRKVLGGILFSCGLPLNDESAWLQFVPASLIPLVRSEGGPLPPTTSFMEEFPGTGAAVGSDLTITETAEGSDNLQRVSGELAYPYDVDGFTQGRARVEHDLSIVDHSSTLAGINHVLNNDTFRITGTWVRRADSADTHYEFLQFSQSGGDEWGSIRKIVAGVETTISVFSATDIPDDVTDFDIRCKVAGSTVSGNRDGVKIQQHTDLAISGNFKGGFRMGTIGNLVGITAVGPWVITDGVSSDGGSAGTGNEKTNDTGIDFNTTLTVESGELAVVIVATDDDSSSDEESSLHSSVTLGGNAMIKAKEFSNADGATISIWYWLATTQVTSGAVVATIISTGRTAKAVTSRVFSVESGFSVSVDGTATLAADAAQPGSLSATGVEIGEHVWIRAIALEEDDGDLGALTPSDGWAAMVGDGTTGGGGATNQSVRAEFQITNGVGSGISDPAVSVVSDNASVLVGLSLSSSNGASVVPIIGGKVIPVP